MKRNSQHVRHGSPSADEPGIVVHPSQQRLIQSNQSPTKSKSTRGETTNAISRVESPRSCRPASKSPSEPTPVPNMGKQSAQHDEPSWELREWLGTLYLVSAVGGWVGACVRACSCARLRMSCGAWMLVCHFHLIICKSCSQSACTHCAIHLYHCVRFLEYSRHTWRGGVSCLDVVQNCGNG